MQQVKTASSYSVPIESSDNSDCENFNLLTMEPIGEMDQNLFGFQPLLIITECFGAILFVLVAVWVTYYRGGFSWTSNVALQFNWHPFLMILGMVLIYSQSMLIYRMSRDTRKKKLKTIHTVLHTFVFIFSVIALVAVFDNHNLSTPPKPNLYSLHSWVGLTTVILFGLQFLMGFVAFIFPMAKLNQRALYMPIHRFFGLGGFVFASAACLLGLNEAGIFLIPTYNQKTSEGLLVNCIGVVIICFGSFVVYLVTKHDYRRVAKEEDGTLLTGYNE